MDARRLKKCGFLSFVWLLSLMLLEGLKFPILGRGNVVRPPEDDCRTPCIDHAWLPLCPVVDIFSLMG